MLSLSGSAGTMADSVILYTPYTKISVSPGQSVEYTVDLINNTKEIITADLSLRGLPSGWNYSIKYSVYNIRQLSVLSGDKRSINLTIAVPVKVNKGSYFIRLVAGNICELPLTITVSEQGTFKTEFSTDQANIQGNTTSVFTYQALLRNSTGEKQLYTITGDEPPGWNVVFKYNGQQVTSVEVKENSNASINIEVDPPDMIEAGTYRIPIHAANNSSSADLILESVIKGSFGMELTTPTGLLSTSITAGDQRQIELVVRNTGSSELKGVQFSAANPVNWDVTFDPKKIDLIQPGKSAQVFATVKAAKNAIAGDYVTNIEAKTPEISAKAQFRISVETSMLWGWMGVLIIAAALGSVYYLFRKYGRR
ncbi:MAG: hypothetical protein IPJ16_16725 [Bacteroidales bacterium]|nr:hypothetical protein [Bacteroidales bacterium]